LPIVVFSNWQKKPFVHNNYPIHKSFLNKLLEHSAKAATPGKRGIIQNYLHLSKKKSNGRHNLSNYLNKILIVICAKFHLGENYNVEKHVLPEAHILNDKHISAHIIRDCCVPYITKGKSGIILPVPGLGVG